MKDIDDELRENGFTFVHTEVMRDRLGACGSLSDWDAFADSWNHLELDAYMADGGRYRRRRHATYGAARGSDIRREAHQPHYQAVEYNRLHGGISRWFEPITQEIVEGASMRTILAFCRSLFERLTPEVTSWRIEVHQFRIEARSGAEGRPTPEGVHRDGVDFVLVLLVARRNIASGVTTIHRLDASAAQPPLGHFTLAEPLDAALVDDRRVAHGVTAVEAIDPSVPAYRDVLVVTFRRAEDARQD